MSHLDDMDDWEDAAGGGSGDEFVDPYAAFEEAHAERRARRMRGTQRGTDDVDEVGVHDDVDDAVEYSPQRPGTQRGHRSPSQNPKQVRTNKGWTLIKANISSLSELETFLEEHGDDVAAGRGFTPCGEWRPNKHQSVRVYRCLYDGCTAQLRAEQNHAGKYCVLKSSTPGHAIHIERHNPKISVPGEVRALLTPMLLAMPPRKLRAHLRPMKLPDGCLVKSAPHQPLRLLQS